MKSLNENYFLYLKLQEMDLKKPETIGSFF